MENNFENGVHPMKKKRCQIVKISDEARVLKELRIKCGFSMREAGYQIGKSDSYISHLENGRMDIPSGEQLEKLLNLYNCSHKGFFEKVRLYKEETPKIEILSNLIKKLDENKVNILIDLTESFLTNTKQRI
jgi:transcriptional regulator with XRE-family HTH domain